MEIAPPDHLTILRQLAQEYQQKYSELEEILQNAKPETVHQQLKLRGELTTDRFRKAQQALLASLSSNVQDGDDQSLKAAAVLCRCFDEMRILFQVLLDRASESAD